MVNIIIQTLCVCYVLSAGLSIILFIISMKCSIRRRVMWVRGYVYVGLRPWNAVALIRIHVHEIQAQWQSFDFIWNLISSQINRCFDCFQTVTWLWVRRTRTSRSGGYKALNRHQLHVPPLSTSISTCCWRRSLELGRLTSEQRTNTTNTNTAY